jgi:hypothetical protein
MLDADSEAEALEWLHANDRTDGLPVVIPTEERVDRMVLASGLDGELDLGPMGPGNGASTIDAIATNAVMAGCRPDDMPVVLAIVQAVMQPAFDLAEMQGTTHSTAPLAIVCGPIAATLGITGGFGALGPGHRANASIGRAVRLCMMNIGGARPGVSDMALLGHPGKFTYCLSEDTSSSPWAPLHTSLGYRAEDNAVVVLGAESPHSAIFVADADDSHSPDRLLDTLAATIANLGSNNAHFRCGAVAVALNPEHVEVLADAGLSRADVQSQLAERATNPRSVLSAINPAFAGVGDPADLIGAVADPADVIVFVAGGSGLYSSVFPSWAAGGHRNPVVTQPVVTDLACEIPALIPTTTNGATP